MLYWIKERQNPQTGTSFTPCGQMRATAAKKKEKTLYGCNIMRSFDTIEAYEAELKRLRDTGERVT